MKATDMGQLASASPVEPGLAKRHATFKPTDVEEPIDAWLNRPIASLLVKLLAPLPISANQVTLLSGAVGVVAGVVIGTAPLDGYWQMLLGAALVFLSILLDCSDGQLARLRGESSMFGRMLDGLVDVVPTAAVFMGLAWFMFKGGESWVVINVVGWAAGYSLKWHVHSYDHAKNLYLENVVGERSGALPTLEQIEQERQRLADKGDRIGAIVVGAFAGFTRSQRRGFQQTRIGLGLPGTRTGAERSAYREAFRSTMRLWSWNGLGTHLWLLILAVVLTPLHHTVALWIWAFVLGPVNLFTFWLQARERSIERALQAELRPAAAVAAGEG